MVALFLSCLNITEVAGNAAAHAEYAGFLVEDVQYLVDVLALFVADELNNSRINVTTSGSHDQTLKRSQAHTGIYALAADGSRYACAVA